MLLGKTELFLRSHTYGEEVELKGCENQKEVENRKRVEKSQRRGVISVASADR